MSSVSHPRGAVGKSVVCDCSIFWEFSLFFQHLKGGFKGSSVGTPPFPPFRKGLDLSETIQNPNITTIIVIFMIKHIRQ